MILNKNPYDAPDTDTVAGITFVKRGNTVSFYGSLDSLSSNTSIVLGTVKEGLRPLNSYACYPFYIKTSPFMPTGTLWVGSNGTITLYKGSETSGYVSGTYVVP